MRIRSFVVAYILVVAILLFADRRPVPVSQTHYSHVVDLTDGPTTTATEKVTVSKTRIIAPASFIPGTWAAGQIPPERLVAPLVVIDLDKKSAASAQISLDDIAAWETVHGMIAPGSLIAIRELNSGTPHLRSVAAPLPIDHDAAQFLIAGRSTIGFATETPVELTSDASLARQLALHGNYVVEDASRFTNLPETGSLVIVAPAKNVKPGQAQVRILAMVR